jgi:hypothetical protein
MKEKYIGLLVGVILLAVAIGFAFLLPEQNVLDFFTILLANIAAVYAGFTFSNPGSKKDVFIEMANIAMYFALLLLSMMITPYFLIAGYFWHGVWDAIHHEKLRLVKTKVPEWYIYGCIFFDWAVGLFLIWWVSL